MEEQKKAAPEKLAEKKADVKALPPAQQKQQEKKPDSKDTAQQKPAEKKEQPERRADAKELPAAAAKQAERKPGPQLPAQAKSGEQRTFQEIRDFSIALDDYDDIFSDFDPRPYNRRELSGDFLREVEKRDMEAGGEKIDVLLFLPKELRKAKNEELILKRIKEHYGAEIKRVAKKVKARKDAGMLFAVAGLTLLVIEAFVVSTPAYAALTGLLGALLVPLGWFTMWTGLDRIVQDPEEDRKRLEMLERMRKAAFVFKAYEEEKKE